MVCRSMTTEVDPQTYGSYLKGFRMQKKMTLETISKRTRIAVHCLLAMEANAHEDLPPQVYVKSFIRAYAQAVGANTDVAISLYRTDLKQQERDLQRDLRRQIKLGVIRRAAFFVVFAAIIVWIIRHLLFFSDLPPPQSAASLQRMERTASMSSKVNGTGGGTRVQPTEALKLQVIAVEKTWLKIIVDGQNAKSYHLKPEDRLELEGTTNFNLMIGNATGVKIFLNERPVQLFGSEGQVVSLKIP